MKICVSSGEWRENVLTFSDRAKDFRKNFSTKCFWTQFNLSIKSSFDDAFLYLCDEPSTNICLHTMEREKLSKEKY